MCFFSARREIKAVQVEKAEVTNLKPHRHTLNPQHNNFILQQKKRQQHNPTCLLCTNKKNAFFLFIKKAAARHSIAYIMPRQSSDEMDVLWGRGVAEGTRTRVEAKSFSRAQGKGRKKKHKIVDDGSENFLPFPPLVYALELRQFFFTLMLEM